MRDATTPEEIAETCELAAEILEKGGWTTREWEIRMVSNEGEVKTFHCVEGAIGAALGMDLDGIRNDVNRREQLSFCPTARAVSETIQLRDGVGALGTGMLSLPFWNDSGNRTQQEVLDVLHATAKRVLGVEA